MTFNLKQLRDRLDEMLATMPEETVVLMEVAGNQAQPIEIVQKYDGTQEVVEVKG